MIGRRETARKPFIKILAQLWSSRKAPESFSAADLKLGANVSASSNDGEGVRVFLQDIPRVLDQHRTATMEGGEFFGEIAALSPHAAHRHGLLRRGRYRTPGNPLAGVARSLRYDSRLKEHVDQNLIASAHSLRTCALFRSFST
jgi:hypothetical protein